MGQRSGGGHPQPWAFLVRRELIAFVPAIGLAALWFGAEAASLVALTAFWVAWMTRPLGPAEAREDDAADGATGLPLRDAAVDAMDAFLEDATARAHGTACLVLGLDQPENLERHLQPSEFEEVLFRTAERLKAVLREHDIVARLDGARFAVMLKPTPRPDLESMIQLSGRLQTAAEAPLSIAKRSIPLSAHVGFCLKGRSVGHDGEAMLSAAEIAAEEAQRNGPSAIRAFSVEVQKTAQARSDLSGEASAALEGGMILPYFQPQLCTDTGRISGVQAIPRWSHPDRGLLTEKDILPAIDAAGLRQRFAEIMLFQCFHALREWDRLGEPFGPVSLPVSPELMTNPKMSERLRWEFDRFDIAPNRIRLILQQNLLPQIRDEVIAHNLAQCHRMGCAIELAGFGASDASVTTIRRSSASRLRVHRSFVARIDTDAEQKRAVAAIISMAEGLGLETLAEGVQTIGEHAALSQLGCRHVQGRAIALPMPLEETIDWARRHRAKLRSTPLLGRKQG
jgi:EAL domain-containing protein (putative c-di-GMP-specific phosphodiesterase class I)/GGDEF domain-containing protein